MMRHLRLLALLAPALLLPVACEDSSTSPATPFTFEAGPGFEAGPPAEAGPLPDAGDIDAADVFVPPVPKGVTVSVIDGLTGKANVRVISHDATGAVIGDAKTDATGKVVMATAPSIVTVLTTANSSSFPVTFFAVADGDNLVVRVPSIAVEQAPIGQYSVTITPPATAPIAAVVAGNGCSGTTSDTSAPILVDLLPNCVGATNAVLADGSDLNGGRVGFAFKKGVAKPAAAAPAVDVVLNAWTAPGDTKLTVLNTPPSSSLAGDLYMIANGAAFPVYGSTGLLDEGGRHFATATGFAEAYQSSIQANSSASGRFAETAIVRRAATTAPATLVLPDVDMAGALPLITAAAIDSTTPARPVVTLTSGALTAVDGCYASLTWLDATDTTATWTFVLPPSAVATFTVPALPADAASFAPVAQTTIGDAVFFEATQVPGYKETKAFPVTPRTRLDLLNTSLPLPADGIVRITLLGPLG